MRDGGEGGEEGDAVHSPSPGHRIFDLGTSTPSSYGTPLSRASVVI